VADAGEEEADDPLGLLADCFEDGRMEAIAGERVVLQAEQVRGVVGECFEAGSVAAPGASFRSARVGDDGGMESCEPVEEVRDQVGAAWMVLDDAGDVQAPTSSASAATGSASKRAASASIRT
jgi:hypothetical protein